MSTKVSSFLPPPHHLLQMNHHPAPDLPPPPPRKRKRIAVPHVSYHTENHVDQSTGSVREVIVLEDTPPPSHLPPPHHQHLASSSSSHIHHYTPTSSLGPSSTYSNGVRTRAQAAAAMATTTAPSVPSMLSTSVGSVDSYSAPSVKRRRRDDAPSAPSGSGATARQAAAGGGALARKAMAGRAYDQHVTKASYNAGWGSGSHLQTTESARATSVQSVRQSHPQQQQPVIQGCDDKEGHYIINPNDMLGSPPRYRIIRLLGQGTFGKVVEAYDTHNRVRVAVKIIRAIPKYRDASKIEIRVLKTLKSRDPTNANQCIHLLECFDHRNHICIVSELLGMCIYDFLKENQFAPFPRRHIQDFARQLCKSVAFLHDLKLIHTDLKPENILLVDNTFRAISVNPPATSSGKRAAPQVKRILNSTEVRLIDFGSATFDNEYHSTVVSTRHYRAPEIILGLGWSFPCDAFSIGCILVEFYTGVALFQTHDNLEHLAMMEAVLGKMPDRFARRGAQSKPEFFKEGARLDWPKPKASRQSRKEVKATRALGDIIKATDVVNVRFVDLVRRLLTFDPAERITVREALMHPFFDLVIPHEQ
ncbi:hypothetical protein BOTBODRAFT_329994 [Botryobasidium botryosum FD-172 SS1]|uniref:Protein kinase domain-containing protein n=1 Tax=Botryobasidium botryosum (strain FD-172 SS1) TaxID=930990 RepID=A0A067MSM4_BOTB1|nr:hypothetical protein BOTBODRAFT_329994 [Botryobasidium botryosum FD-172 SS1]